LSEGEFILKIWVVQIFQVLKNISLNKKFLKFNKKYCPYFKEFEFF